MANNLTTTAAGYVLDARQGKILSDKMWSATVKSITIPAGATNRGVVTPTFTDFIGKVVYYTEAVTANTGFPFHVQACSVNESTGKVTLVYDTTSTAEFTITVSFYTK